MRLFIAICFSDQVKSQLNQTVQYLKDIAKSGSFIPADNLHLTLVFIGEVSGYSKIIQTMETVQISPFSINIGGVDHFPRNDGAIYWIGVQKNPILQDLYGQLFHSLTQNGISLENRTYKPHITLARRVHLFENVDLDSFSKTIPEIHLQVDSIFLMNSVRIQGRMVYTPLYRKEL